MPLCGSLNIPFRYDLNKIPYNYTVEVRNGLDLIDRVPEELWFMTLYRRQGSRYKDLQHRGVWISPDFIRVGTSRRTLTIKTNVAVLGIKF